MKNYRTLLIAFLVGSTLAHCQERQARQDTDGLSPEVVRTIERRVEEGVNQSIALAVIDSAGTRYYNFGTDTPGGDAVDEHSIYEIGSITKVFTGILLAQQILDGDLNADDPIDNYLPDGVRVPVMGDRVIAFGDLTDHTSGLPRLPANMAPANPANPYADYSVEQMYNFIATYQPVREVGAEYEYSNLAQGLLGHLLAENKHATYEALVSDVITGPLNMAETAITLSAGMQEHLAPGHSAGRQVENWDLPTLAGAGAIRSSTADMARFLAANLGFTDIPLNNAMQLSHKPRHNMAGEMRVGMGWHIKKGAQGDVVWHNGGTGGYRAFAGFVKETGRGVVLLTNSSQGVDDIGFHLLDPGSELAHINFRSDALSLPEDTLERYVGVYEVQPEFRLTITRNRAQLYVQATGQNRFEIFASEATRFFLTAVPAEIVFHLSDGIVTGLTLFQGGQEVPGKKIE